MLPGRSAGCLVSSPYSVVVGSPALDSSPFGAAGHCFSCFCRGRWGVLGRFWRRFVCGVAVGFWAVSVGRFGFASSVVSWSFAFSVLAFEKHCRTLAVQRKDVIHE